MKHYDAVVIGGGILGCFAARNLCRWNISVLLIESAEDVCTGITRANSAIVYAGYDMKPGTRKAEMTVRANAAFDTLCQELDVSFSRCGSLMVASGPKGYASLEKKLKAGQRNQVQGLKLLSGMEAQALEPLLAESVTAALYAPSTGTVNPWQLGIAAYENALQNGCSALLGTNVSGITKEADGYVIHTHNEDIFCRAVINCAGLNAVQVQQLVYPTDISLALDGADYLVMDKIASSPAHIIFQESEDGKGITAIPCVEGNLLLESTARPLGDFFATSAPSMESVKTAVHQAMPSIDTSQIIRSFGAVRPNPHRSTGESIHDFCIEQPAADFISFIGIKTPGLTCANELGQYAAETIASYLAATPNTQFNPCRQAIVATDHEIICHCEQITKSEILQAIARGATSVEMIKRRVGSGMGRCQGSRCTWKIQQILEECQYGTL